METKDIINKRWQIFEEENSNKCRKIGKYI